MAAVVMHRFSVLAAPSVRSQGTVLGGVFTQWGNKKYMNMKHLEAAVEDTSIAG